MRTRENKMMEKIHKYILPQGIIKAVYSIGAAVLFALLDMEILSFLCFVIALLFLYVYRKPNRLHVNISDYAVCSPVDGFVLDVEEFGEGEYGYKLTIESSLVESAMVSAPFDAKVVSLSLKRGSRLPFESPLFDRLNERLEALFQTGEKRVKVKHTLKKSPLRIEILKNVEQMRCGEFYAFVYNAVTVVYLPKEFRLNNIHVGKRLYASQSIIGYFSN